MRDKNIQMGAEVPLLDISFGKILFDSLHRHGPLVAMVDAASGCETTYAEILQKSTSLAVHLKSLGLNQGDIISISSENSANFSIAALSAMYLGVVVAPCNPTYTPRELIHSLNIFKPSVMFCSSFSLRTVLHAARDVSSLRKVILMDNNAEAPAGVDRLADYLYLPVPKDFEPTPTHLEDPVAILCSSGTTGLPKGVVLSHKNFQCAFYGLTLPEFVYFHSSKTGMGLLPFYHAFGFITMLSMIALHMSFVLFGRFEERLFLGSIHKYKITFLILVPPLVLLLAKSPLVDEYDLSSVTEILCGAAPLGKDVRDLVSIRLGQWYILQGYGLTESTLAVTCQPRTDMKSGSSGLPMPGIRYKISDVATGNTLGPNETGELCTRGPLLMKGYFGNEAASVAAIDANGWLHTGDIGYFDEDGHLYIVDRFKELIKYKAYQVPPAEIEALLLSHPQISDCAVIGKPDEKVGELPMAFIVKQQDATITEKDVQDFVSENVSAQKRLHGGVVFVEAIPKSPTGKILRRILREQVAAKSKL